jgi:hypothetical protein
MLGITAVDPSTSSSQIYHRWWTEARKFSDKRKKRSADEEKTMHCIEWRDIDTVLFPVDNAALRHSRTTTIIGGIEACDRCIRFWASQLMASRSDAVLTSLCSLSDPNSSSYSLGR